MNVTFFDLQDQSNALDGVTIEGDKELLSLLDSLRDRVPFFAELRGENGYHLVLGIGEVGCAEYSHGEGHPPYLVALAEAPHESKDYTGFMAGGTLTPVPRRFVMPFEQVKHIALYFRNIGGRSPSVSWEEI